jgi:hypothetical protein
MMPTNSPTAAADTLLTHRLRSIAAKWPAVKYHPEDPHADLINRVASQLRLVTIASPAVGYRQVLGCVLPVDDEPAAVGTAALEALTGAVVAATPDTEPARNRAYAQQLLLHLAAAGWTLVRA